MKKNNADPEIEAAFFREVEESVKNDRLKQLWDKYGLAIIVGVALILTATVSFESFRAWRDKKMSEMSNAYAVALALQNQGKYEESAKLLGMISEESSGIYGDIAELQLANLYLSEGKNEEAVNILKKIVQDKKMRPELRDVARVKLASYLLDTAPAEEVKALLVPLNQPDNEWNVIAKEMLAMLAIREGNEVEAIALYQEIADASSVDDYVKTRARDMISVLEQN